MQEENVKNGFLDGSMYYSPSASLFVTTVCDAIRDDEMFYNTKLLQEDKKRSDIV
ncbi:hypothetical protein KA478_02395 [Patescibacteria group bacterium]|nr:hypothetical protein [Patescibacteria group bacterium]